MAPSRYYSSIAVDTTTTADITDSATTMRVASMSGFPSTYPYTLILAEDEATEEIVEVTAYVAPNLTITRGVDGTTGRAHASGTTVHHGVSARDFTESREHEDDSTAVHGIADTAALVTLTGTQTLTNKTIDGDSNTIQDVPASAVKARPINDQSGTTYTFALADASKHVIGSNAGTKTFTIPLQAAVTWLADTRLIVTNTGAGVMTLAITATGTLNGSDLTLAQGESAALLRTASDVWWCLPFSSASGAIPRGTLSGTTGSPATSSNGGATAYKWTSSGSFTVATAGQFDALIVGGGGAGGAGASAAFGGGGGGGGGGMLTLTSLYLAAGTYTVTVGAGGASGGRNPGGASAIGSFIAAGGGAAGSGGNDANTDKATGGHGGSGGGAGYLTSGTYYAGKGIPGQGYDGAASVNGGGGGAGGAGSGTSGGAGAASSLFTGSPVTYAAGGSTTSSAAGGANTGDGGSATPGNTAAGGSGIVGLLVGTV